MVSRNNHKAPIFGMNERLQSEKEYIVGSDQYKVGSWKRKAIWKMRVCRSVVNHSSDSKLSISHSSDLNCELVVFSNIQVHTRSGVFFNHLSHCCLRHHQHIHNIITCNIISMATQSRWQEAFFKPSFKHSNEFQARKLVHNTQEKLKMEIV